MKITIPNKEDRILHLKVEHGSMGEDKPMIWDVKFRMLTMEQRNAISVAEMTATPNERIQAITAMVLRQIESVSHSDVELAYGDEGKEIDWSDKAVVESVLSQESVFGAAFLHRVWWAYEKELDDRLGNLQSP
jgi:hypothetical protein